MNCRYNVKFGKNREVDFLLFDWRLSKVRTENKKIVLTYICKVIIDAGLLLLQLFYIQTDNPH